MSVVQKLARPDLWDAARYRSRGTGGEVSLRLNCNENPWPPLGCDDRLLNRYPEKQPVELLNRLAEMYECPADNLLITRGADDGIDAILRAFCKPGADQIVQCPPAFVMYGFFARIQGLQVVNVPLQSNDSFSVDFGALKLASDNGGKVLFVCSPNNPTGSIVDGRAICRLARQVEQQSLVVVDEAYIEFANEKSLVSLVEEHANLVVLRTLSKAWSLAAARLGVVAGSREMIEYLNSTISPYPLCRPAVNAAITALAEDNSLEARARVEELKQNRDVLAKSLVRFDWIETIYPSQGNFLLLKVNDAESLMKFAEERGALLRNQSSQLGLQNHVRVSAGSRDEMDALLNIFREYEVKA